MIGQRGHMMQHLEVYLISDLVCIPSSPILHRKEIILFLLFSAANVVAFQQQTYSADKVASCGASSAKLE